MSTSKLSTKTTLTKRAATDNLPNPGKRAFKDDSMRNFVFFEGDDDEEEEVAETDALQPEDYPFNSGDDSDLAETDAETALDQQPEAEVLPLAPSGSTEASSEMDMIFANRTDIRAQMLADLPLIPVVFREFSKTDEMLRACKGINVEAKLEAFIKKFATNNTSAAAIATTRDTLYLALTSVSTEYNDLQSFLKYLKNQTWYNVLGNLCEKVFGLEHTGDKKREVRKFLDLCFLGLRQLAIDAL